MVVTLTEYEEGLPVAVAFPPVVVTSLAELVSALGWRQFHVAETEKYAHVTYFFNGGVEQAWPGEDRLLIPSPKVATYDLEPAMSAVAVTDALVAAIERGTLRPHRGQLRQPRHGRPHGRLGRRPWPPARSSTAASAASPDAVLAADAASRGRGWPGALLAITADHGNADVMRDAAGAVVTAHSLSLVPFLLAGSRGDGHPDARRACSADVAPTLLEFLGLPLAEGMTGSSVACSPDRAAPGQADRDREARAILSRRPTAPSWSPLAPVNPLLAIASIARLDRAHRGRPAPVARRRPRRHLRWRVVRLSQPARRREDAVPVHDRAGGRCSWSSSMSRS